MTNKNGDNPEKSGDVTSATISKQVPGQNNDTIKTISIFIVVAGFVVITALAGIAIFVGKSDPSSILNIVLPVFATWVGTVIAFYFGKENFDAASAQIQKTNEKVNSLLAKDTSRDKTKKPVSDLMKKIDEITCYVIPKGKTEKDITLAEIRQKFNEDDGITRLPILDSDKNPEYMIHASRIDQYIAGGKKETDFLDIFLDDRKKAGYEFGLNTGFIVVSESETIGDAKLLLDKISSCQDIFVTKKGTNQEPLTGWISNIRLTRYLKG
jgi:hypothetical protein